jgi:hypothetical protein
MAQRIWSGWSETVLCVTGQVGLEQAKALAEAAFCLPGLRQAQRHPQGRERAENATGDESPLQIGSGLIVGR